MTGEKKGQGAKRLDKATDTTTWQKTTAEAWCDAPGRQNHRVDQSALVLMQLLAGGPRLPALIQQLYSSVHHQKASLASI